MESALQPPTLSSKVNTTYETLLYQQVCDITDSKNTFADRAFDPGGCPCDEMGAGWVLEVALIRIAQNPTNE